MVHADVGFRIWTNLARLTESAPMGKNPVTKAKTTLDKSVTLTRGADVLECNSTNSE
jgi:hypothetical protein